nr:uncharacterized protein LOC111512245 [Leptinotarsa decemlineata]
MLCFDPGSRWRMLHEHIMVLWMILIKASSYKTKQFLKNIKPRPTVSSVEEILSNNNSETHNIEEYEGNNEVSENDFEGIGEQNGFKTILRPMILVLRIEESERGCKRNLKHI